MRGIDGSAASAAGMAEQRAAFLWGGPMDGLTLPLRAESTIIEHSDGGFYTQVPGSSRYVWRHDLPDSPD